jgi:hypothetical protein
MKRVPDDTDPVEIVKDLAQHLEPLADELGRDLRHAGDVAARLVEARDETFAHGVAAVRHHDRNRLRSRPRRDNRLGPGTR